MSILLICMDTARARSVATSAERALARGHVVFLITAEARGWPDLDPRVQLIDLGGIQASEPLLRLERLVTVRIPRKLFAVVLTALAAVERTAMRRLARHAAGAVRHVAAAYDRAAGKVHVRAFLPAYRRVQPWLDSRATRRAVASRVALSGVEQIVVQDGGGLIVAERLLRAHPQLRVGFELAPPVAAAPTISA